MGNSTSFLPSLQWPSSKCVKHTEFVESFALIILVIKTSNFHQEMAEKSLKYSTSVFRLKFAHHSTSAVLQFYGFCIWFLIIDSSIRVNKLLKNVFWGYPLCSHTYACPCWKRGWLLKSRVKSCPQNWNCCTWWHIHLARTEAPL